MKKAIIYYFTLLLILLSFSVILVSCKSQQTLPPDINKEIVNKSDSLTDVTTTDHSKAIIDSLSWQIAKIKTANKDCDSLAQDAVNKVLKSLNVKKSSGDNGYEMKYNALKRQFDLIVNIAATQNRNSTKNQQKTRQSYKLITKTITVKERLPKWKLYLMIIGGVSLLFCSFKAVLAVKSKILK